MPTLQIQLLGNFQLLSNGEPLHTLNQGRLQSLLAYLVLQRAAPQSRQHLAFLFWPDSSEAQARANLRQTLHQLRQALPDVDHLLQIDSKAVQWQADASFTLDVAEFERHLTQADEAAQRGDDTGERAALQAAVAYYRGDLLLGCYDEWLLPEREHWQQAFLKALERLILLAEAQRDYGVAIDYAQRLLRSDPLHETTYACLMRLYALKGDRASALRVYHTCATLLQRELGVEPNLQTQSAYEHLLHLEQPAALPSTFDTQHGTLKIPASGLRHMPHGEQFVGRQTEWQQLLTTWRTATRGRASLLVVAGEAGIGKTRLAEELATWVGRQGIRTARTRAYAAEGALAYAPVAEWLRLEALRAGWQRLDAVWLTELARILPELLVEQPRLPRPEPLSESWQRRRLFEALGRAVLTDNRPLLLVLDDLQWCDHETLEWLRYLLRSAPQAPLLILGTVRPEEVNRDHPLTTLLLDLRSTEQVTELELGALSSNETAALVVQLAGQDLAPEVAQRLYNETEGNPLFVVETLRAEFSREAGTPRGGGGSFSLSPLPAHGPLPLPAKIHAVIQRRLAQLSPPARELASLAAVLGRSFTFPVLVQASDLAEDALMRGLDELWQRRIVRELGADAYDFSHDRIREVSQATISQTQRRLLHRRAAQALEQVYASDLVPVIGQIAAHYERAGLAELAIASYLRAAEVARQLYATQDAISYFTSGLALLKSLPNPTLRAHQEIALQIGLGNALITAEGMDFPDARRAFARARDLCQQLGEMPAQLFPALWGLWLSYVSNAEHQTAWKLGDQLLRLSQREDEPDLLLQAHHTLWATSFFLGEFDATLRHCQQGTALYEPEKHHKQLFRYGEHDAGVCSLSVGSLALWALGYPDQALRRALQALALAQELAHPITRAQSLTWLAIVHQLRREDQAVLERAQAASFLATERKVVFWRGWGISLQGWSLAQQGRGEEGIAQLQQGLAIPMLMNRTYFLALLAELYGQVGQATAGLAVLVEALAEVNASGERWYEAELVRLYGELLATSRAAEAEVESHFHQALAIARRQGARLLELRAAVSLGRLWQQQGRVQEAHDLVAEIYNRFTEGFDTRDLQEASALLERLS
jgi:predicted ATPase/DNA-binding SARP family transcriptional activator